MNLQAATYQYSGAVKPGGYVLGTLTDCQSFELNGIQAKCAEDGQFVLGFGRDRQGEQTVTFTLSDQSKVTKTFDLGSREYDVQRIEGVEKKYVSPPKETLARIKNDNKQIGAARNVVSTLNGYKQDFIWPAQGRISGVFGSQRVFNGTPKRPHFGLDVANKTGTPVISPADGVVTLAHPDMYYSGGTLIIDHGAGLTSTYIHLSKIDVAKGDVVKQGDLIGKIGATGRVTGPHLDWRINWYSERLDPAFWVPAGGNQPQ
ncbi:M23 family metallopeptidase [Catenovulum sp. SM1970]|nr:M23 family metallopeptidase [Marinifaba aquimaris]